MPTLVTGTLKTRSRSIGFTLIEILVVVTIVAIVMSVALLSINLARDDRDLQTEGKRFAALFQVALDEAVLQGREYGLELMTAGFRFAEYDVIQGVWIELPEDDTLRLRALPEDLEFELYMEDKRVLLDDNPKAFDDPEKPEQSSLAERYSPHLLLYSSGDVTPFELQVWRRSDDARFIVRGDGFGSIEFGGKTE